MNKEKVEKIAKLLVAAPKHPDTDCGQGIIMADENLKLGNMTHYGTFVTVSGPYASMVKIKDFLKEKKFQYIPYKRIWACFWNQCKWDEIEAGIKGILNGDGQRGESMNDSASGDFSDIWLLDEGGPGVHFVRNWNTFNQPMFIPELKSEIDSFKAKCCALLNVIAKALPGSVIGQLLDHFAKDDAYEWEWNDRWIYTVTIPASKEEKKVIAEICKKSGVKVPGLNQYEK